MSLCEKFSEPIKVKVLKDFNPFKFYQLFILEIKNSCSWKFNFQNGYQWMLIFKVCGDR